MKLERYPQRYRLLVLTLFAALHLLSNLARADDLQFGNMKANRILFFGNSITLSPIPVSGTDWPGGWGMAASSPEKDYVHRLVASIGETAGRTPEFMATYNLAFEQNYATYDLNSPAIQQQLAFNPDIVVVAIGENVPTLTTPQARAQYAAAFGSLLNLFKNHGSPEIFVRSCFWTDATKDNIMKQATEAAGCVFVDQSALGVQSNWAVNEPGNPFQNAGGGINAHPGDKGMKAIADSLYGAMAAHATPEPTPVAMLGIAVPLLAAAVLRRRRVAGFKDCVE